MEQTSECKIKQKKANDNENDNFKQIKRYKTVERKNKMLEFTLKDACY